MAARLVVVARDKCVLGAALLLVLLVSSTGLSQTANDKFEGAIWRFKMTPKQRGLRPLGGIFRVSNSLLFQKHKRRDSGFKKEIGRNYPGGRRARIEFKDLRAFADNGKVQVNGIKGTARLTMDSVGNWSGLFTDGKGRNWDFKCERVQE